MRQAATATMEDLFGADEDECRDANPVRCEPVLQVTADPKTATMHELFGKRASWGHHWFTAGNDSEEDEEEPISCLASWQPTLRRGTRLPRWDVARELMPALNDHHNRTGLRQNDSEYTLAFSPSGQFLAAAQRDGRIAIYSPMLKEPIGTLDGHPAAKCEPPAWQMGSVGLVFNHTSTVLASGYRDAIILWDLQTFCQLEVLTRTCSARSIGGISQSSGRGRLVMDFSQDGRMLISACDKALGSRVSTADRYAHCTTDRSQLLCQS
jgi:WD40 repeat protein